MSLLLKYLEIKFNLLLGKIPKSPAIVNIELLVGCNLRCKNCDQWRIYSKNKNYKQSELKTEEWKRLVGELGYLKIPAVGITGGEPLLHPGIFDIIKELKKNNIIVHLNTNGTLNSDENIKNIVESGVDSVTVSIDNYGKEHDKLRGVPVTFNKSIEMVKKLKKAGINRIGICTLLMGQNISHIERLSELAKELDIEISFSGFDIGLLKYNINDKKKIYQNFNENIDKILSLREKNKQIIVLPEYLEYMKKQIKYENTIKWCRAGYVTCLIRSNGDVVPCYQLPSIGNIKQKSFKEIWNSDQMKETRNRIKRGCKGCFSNCGIEPSIIFNNPRAAFNFYKIKLSRI